MHPPNRRGIKNSKLARAGRGTAVNITRGADDQNEMRPTSERHESHAGESESHTTALKPVQSVAQEQESSEERTGVHHVEHHSSDRQVAGPPRHPAPQETRGHGRHGGQPPRESTARDPLGEPGAEDPHEEERYDGQYGHVGSLIITAK